jgi:two-component system nitrate/nitrite response regulator NarL
MRIVPTVLVERSTLVREGLERILSGTCFRVAAAVSSPDELKATVSSELRSILIILGVSDDGHSPTQDIEALRSRFASAQIVILADRYEVAPLAEALRLSVSGYLSKSISSASLIKALELIMLGEGIFPSSILAQLGRSSEPEDELSVEAPEEPRLRQATMMLSVREIQILRGLVDGLSNKTIARQFDIMEATVKVHVKAILRKIGVQNRTQAAIWALNRLESTGPLDFSVPPCAIDGALPPRPLGITSGNGANPQLKWNGN